MQKAFALSSDKQYNYWSSGKIRTQLRVDVALVMFAIERKILITFIRYLNL